MRIISVASRKGGTGKTTTTVNLGAGLAHLAKKVLLIDLDPQAHLSFHLGFKNKGLSEQKKTITYLFSESKSYKELIRNTADPYLDIIASDKFMADVEASLPSIENGSFILKKELEELSGYDFVLLDSPPAMGMLAVNGLCYAKELLIPVQVEILALDGMIELFENISMIKSDLNPRLKTMGIVATRFDSRNNLSQQVVDLLRKQYKNILFDTIIRDNVRIAEAPSFAKTIIEYSPASFGAEDYIKLAKEVIERG